MPLEDEDYSDVIPTEEQQERIDRMFNQYKSVMQPAIERKRQELIESFKKDRENVESAFLAMLAEIPKEYLQMPVGEFMEAVRKLEEREAQNATSTVKEQSSQSAESSNEMDDNQNSQSEDITEEDEKENKDTDILQESELDLDVENLFQNRLSDNLSVQTKKKKTGKRKAPVAKSKKKASTKCTPATSRIPKNIGATPWSEAANLKDLTASTARTRFIRATDRIGGAQTQLLSVNGSPLVMVPGKNIGSKKDFLKHINTQVKLLQEQARKLQEDD